MDTIFLSHFLDPKTTPSYGNREGQLIVENASCICAGDSSNGLKITLSNHIGTHIDLPRHFDDKGKVLNDYAASDWVFHSPQLIELPKGEGEFICFDELSTKLLEHTDLLLIRTGFEKFRTEKVYWEKNPGFTESTGRLLRENFPNLKVIGFDFISITSYTDRMLGRKAHRSFLSSEFPHAPIRAIEDMKLEHLVESPRTVIVAPLLLSKADGIQVTVIANF